MFMTETNNERDDLANLRAAEQLLESSPGQARVILLRLTHRQIHPDVRAQAYSLLAMRSARMGSQRGYSSARMRLNQAGKLKDLSTLAQARVAHARGYLATKQGDIPTAISELNRAAHLYQGNEQRRAHVFDSLGMLFANLGDLQRAQGYYLLSLKIKRSLGVDQERYGIAITCGNLGRLELEREEYQLAEHWFREDLCLVEQGAANPTVIALIRNQLALALLGQGPSKATEAQEELQKAAALVNPESATHAFILKDLARTSLIQQDLDKAEEYLKAAQHLIQTHIYAEAALWVSYVESLLASQRCKTIGDSYFQSALISFEKTLQGFRKLNMHHEVCKVLLDYVELHLKVSNKDQALRILSEQALPTAERYLFKQTDPLARIEQRIEELEPTYLWKVRVRRLLGKDVSNENMARLSARRRQLTIWTCDIRGFCNFCDQAQDEIHVVQMLNYFFEVIGQQIIDLGGQIDKYIGDNILAYFSDPSTACDMALAAKQLIEQLNTEREHLDEPQIAIGIGIASGEVIVGNVGFARKLEHTVIGTAVNLAARLVSIAEPGEILLDRATFEHIPSSYPIVPMAGGMRDLKGIGQVEVFSLLVESTAQPNTL
jgi:class 3 adenylate cyclase